LGLHFCYEKGCDGGRVKRNKKYKNFNQDKQNDSILSIVSGLSKAKKRPKSDLFQLGAPAFSRKSRQARGKVGEPSGRM
jgi:hypothetical protein